ncbi:MAG: hypothetical protein LUG66_09605 [Clostridiales bacterium]|nr:hypothetical protein [Clostridiales bacterium]
MLSALQTFIDNERNKWQEDTLIELRNRLTNNSDDIYDDINIKSSKYVVIYGVSQIGKTTLIIHLMNIKPECRGEVYKILRAGQPKGESSTSTAIIYRQSEDMNKFGICQSEDDVVFNSSIKYYFEQEFINALKSVRKEVENGKYKGGILYIYLPKKYFNAASPEYSDINIMDLPGYGSRNDKERENPSPIINKYVNLADVRIVACQGHELQSLENIKIGNTDWMDFPNRYCVVLTKAYGQENIRKYFKSEKSKRPKPTFYEYVIDEYNKEKKVKTPKLDKINIFPIEIGESLEALTNPQKNSSELIRDISDRRELSTAVEKTINDIKKYIAEHKGNSFRNIIEELQKQTENYIKTEIDNCKAEIKKLNSEIAYNKNKLNKDKEKLEKFRAELNGLKPSFDRYEKIRKDWDLSTISYEEFYDGFIDDISGIFGMDSEVRFRDDKINFIYNSLSERLSDFLKKYLKLYNNKYIELGIIKNSSESELNKVCENITGSLTSAFEIKLKAVEKKLIFRYIFRDKAYECAVKAFKYYEENLEHYLNAAYNSFIDENGSVSERYYVLSATCRNLESTKRNSNEELNKSLKNLNKREEDKRDLEREKADCDDILLSYKETAETHFLRQKAELTDKINDASKAWRKSVLKHSDDIIKPLLCLSIIEYDYNKIVKGE